MRKNCLSKTNLEGGFFKLFLIKIFHFLKGYVILSISGHNKEEFVNSLFSERIIPHNLKQDNERILAQISLTDFFRIRSTKVRSQVHIEKKAGLVFLLKKMRRRIAFFVGLIFFLLLFILGSQFVWTVSYEGVENCDKNQLEEAVDLAGLSEGKLKRNLKTPVEMKNIILNNTDGICWAWVYIKGTKAIVKVREDIIPPEVYEPEVPCDIIAMRNGIIKNVITKHGRCIATVNQAVTAGDTIISGTYKLKNEAGYQVHAAGDVFAYTTHTKTGTYKQNYCYKKYTGRKRNILTLRLFKWDVPLCIDRDIKFEMYDEVLREYDLKIGKDFYTGIGITKESFAEYTTESEPVSYDAAVLFAQNELEKDISRELLPGAELVGKDLNVEKIDEDTISVTVTMNFVEKIGTEKRIEEVTFVEPKTDNFAAGG